MFDIYLKKLSAHSQVHPSEIKRILHILLYVLLST